MKILAFSDLHRETGAASALLAASAEADVVVGAGDFATKGQGAAEILEVLARGRVPVVLVHGNHDNPAEMESICRQSDSLNYLHGNALSVGGMAFFGLGGEIPSRSDTSWNVTETEARAAKLLENCPQNAILVTHTPPYGVADLQKNGEHEGSAAIRDATLKHAPQLLLCGHIHHGWGSSGKLGSSFVQNLGPTANWFDV